MSIGYRPSLVERWHLSPTGSTLSKRLKPGVWAGSIALALLIASATGIPANAQSGSAATDRAALVALYDATDGPNWTNTKNWLSDKPLHSWYGVTTDDTGRVTTLDLAGIGLEGALLRNLRVRDRDLGTPDNLSDPDRDYNEPNRQIPQRIPPELGGLTNLHRLDLSGNHLTGQIPSQLANLANLEHLDLSDNRLTGQIPSEIGNLANLKYLDLTSPDSDRSLPRSQPRRNTWTQPQLRPIPSEIGNLANLKYLDLCHNGLRQIPRSLVASSALGNLRFDYNAGLCRQTTRLPQSDNLANLKDLDLWHNQLNQIPSEIGSLGSLSPGPASTNWADRFLELGNLGNLERCGSAATNSADRSQPRSATSAT